MGCVVNTRHGKKMVNYQDIWFKGRPIVSGGRECQQRYHAIEKFIKKFKRPISVLDIGANMGYFSLRLMERFQGSFTMIEGDEFTANVLLRLCKLNRNPGAILLKRRLSLSDIVSLAESTHFDVVFALSVIHHFDEPYQQVLEALTRLGSYLIFEPPSLIENTANQERIINEPLDLSSYKKKVLVRALTKTVARKIIFRETYAIDCQTNKKIIRPFFNSSREMQEAKIQTDFKKREVFFPHLNRVEEFATGINFSTFLALNGVYPTKSKILNLLHDLKFSDEENVRPWELILTGERLDHFKPHLKLVENIIKEKSCSFKFLKDHIATGLRE